MTGRNLIWVSLFATLPLWAQANKFQSNQHSNAQQEAQIEPNAGNWRTWVISSGKDYRVPPPPGHAETRAELRSLADLISHNDAQTQQQIQFWDAGAPAYRWM